MKRNGFTLVEVITSAAILGISTLAVGAFTSASSQIQRKTTVKLSITQAKSNVLTLLSNQTVWNKHIELANSTDPTTGQPLNPELLCLKDGTACTEGSYNLSVVDKNGNVVINANDLSQGFTRNGAVCNTFNADTFNPACPWRLQVRWSPTCRLAAEGPCLRPQLSIQIEVVSSTQFLTENMIQSAQVAHIIDQPLYAPPVARRTTGITNSTHYAWNSTINIDPSAQVTTESPGTIVYHAPASGQSKMGGTVSLSGNHFVYTAPTNFYGSDLFIYTLTDSYTGHTSTGVAYVKVMTPWTWLGTTDSNINTATNYCGQVINGSCDHVTFPPVGTGYRDKHIVLNENCDQCDMNIPTATRVMTLETGIYYNGTITQGANFTLGHTSSSAWQKFPTFKMSGGTWQGGNTSTFQVEPSLTTSLGKVGFVLDGGEFRAPLNMIIISDLFMDRGASFFHDNHTVQWSGSYNNGDKLGGDGTVVFYNFHFGRPGMTGGNFRQKVLNSITVANNTYINPQSTDQGPVLVAESAPSTQITALGDLYLNNTGNYGGCRPPSSNSSASLVFAGTADQTIYGQNSSVDGTIASYSCAPMLIVNKATGTMNFRDFIAIRGGLVLQNAPSYNFHNSTLAFSGKGGPDMPLTTNGVALNNLNYDSDDMPQNLVLTNDTTVQGDFKFRARATTSGSAFMV
ncbi:MAG: Ig-like domain-containing protein, partial [Bdellovibrio sp.]